ncbi:sulfatase-like hydrolase/transferase [Roseibium sp.]|uniref:sulfatase-like hydrolase/transferase n=1 Tax=Roseibium sp. TaxID=1936156 RepID=UPI003B518CFD
MKFPLKTLVALTLFPAIAWAQPAEIVHDAEYYVLERQHAETWATDDAAVDARLAELREANGGAPPNILYILIDDIGFGEIGTPYLNYVCGYETPNINDFAEDGLRLMRMYTEPSCTLTRVAFMTGRQPYRLGMAKTSVAMDGFGMAAEEITLAEVLKAEGYNTSHVGKWHIGDISESFPHNQGFDYAAFPVHQQAQLALFSRDSHEANQTIGLDYTQFDDKWVLDRSFRPVPGTMVTGLEAVTGGSAKEVDLQPGEEWTQAKYLEMNERYQRQALEQLDALVAQDEPFFLQYWPLLPLTFTRPDVSQFTSPNGGFQTESMQKVDAWIGDILERLEESGKADNTIVIIMGDNGNFTKYAPYSGYSPMIYRGGKGDATEGGVRVDAFIRWPAAIEADSYVGDMIHVADLFTTLARIAGGLDHLPTDRVIDGVDQTSMLLLGEGKGRRDHVFIYQSFKLAALVKEHFKLDLSSAGSNLVVAPFYDLLRDQGEKYPVATPVGAWAASPIERILERHMAWKKRYPDLPAAVDTPYSGIDNLRPETVAMREEWLTWKRQIGAYE